MAETDDSLRVILATCRANSKRQHSMRGMELADIVGELLEARRLLRELKPHIPIDQMPLRVRVRNLVGWR